MLSKKAQSLLTPLCKQPQTYKSISELKREANESSNNMMSQAIKQWKEEGILEEIKIGRNILLRIDTANEKALQWLILTSFENIPEKVRKTIKKTQQAFTERGLLWYSLVLFGSHAQEKASNQSDIDLLVLAEQTQKTREAANTATRTIPRIDLHIHTPEEFKEMLDDDEENLAKLIATNHKAIHNPRPFYEIIERSRYKTALQALSRTGEQ